MTGSHEGKRGMSFGRLLPYLVIAWCLGWMGYGFASYPYAPLKPCGRDVFCDKRNNEYTLREYEDFRYWETVLFVSWPFGMVAGYVLKKRKQ
ncbi:hypothetical protein [uncultured Massilia sp.]|uniref:hypothetical protein n=1 Tax=uncultured Massilia sp. TaxID=169973 RepID=UPI0025F30D3F|nr:hypothetical protein [uncultured Massilia sp.]